MNYNRKARALVFLAAALCALSFGAPAEKLTCIVADGQYVNVRNRASSSAATWGILHTGDLIETNPKDIANGFFKTTFDDRIAYVSVRYFEIPADQPHIVEANGRVRLRMSPAGESAGFIKPGKTVHVQGWRYAADGSKWARCAGGRYIAAQYLRPME